MMIEETMCSAAVYEAADEALAVEREANRARIRDARRQEVWRTGTSALRATATEITDVARRTSDPVARRIHPNPRIQHKNRMRWEAESKARSLRFRAVAKSLGLS